MIRLQTANTPPRLALLHENLERVQIKRKTERSTSNHPQDSGKDKDSTKHPGPGRRLPRENASAEEQNVSRFTSHRSTEAQSLKI